MAAGTTAARSVTWLVEEIDPDFDVIEPVLTYYKKPRNIEILNCVDPYTGIISNVGVISEFKDDIKSLTTRSYKVKTEVIHTLVENHFENENQNQNCASHPSAI